MSAWMHLELNFNNQDFSKQAFPQRKPEGTYKELIIYLNQVVNSLSALINRYFFLFEPNPHLFLALEVKDINDYESAKGEISKITKPAFVASLEVKFNTGDGNHPEGALDFFCASTKYAFFRATDAYIPGYYKNDETKLIHCYCNQLFASQSGELFFLLKCAFNRGILKLGDVIQALRSSGFPNDIPEYLFWDVAKKKISYNDQTVYIFEEAGKFSYLVVNLGIQQGLVGANALLSSLQEAEDKARELIDSNIKSGIWVIKPVV